MTDSEQKRLPNEPTFSVELECEDGKNKRAVKCQFCPSRILNPGIGTFENSEFVLPTMLRLKDKNPGTISEEEETLAHFWTVANMYSFENIGFSHTTGNIKYLACADCETGPIGYHNLDSKVSYIALGRVCHVN